MSNYKTETQQLSAQLINGNFVRKIEEGRTKEAEAEGSAFIRTKMRQESFAREIIEPILLGDDEIDRDEDTDQPKKIVEKEPDSVATFVPFSGTGPRTWFKGPRFAVYFGKVTTPRFTKSKFELMTYQNDIRKILSDNSVKDMADEEDKKFIATVDEILALNPTQVSSAGAFGSSPFKGAVQGLVGRRMPIGKVLMSKILFLESIDLPATTVGNDVATRHYDKGVEGEEKLWGIPVVTTIKSDIVDGTAGDRRSAYFFAPQNYLGVFYLLQDATLFIKQEADIIEFYSYESLGMGIGNTKGVARIDFPVV